jgi:hypothetical protein
MREDDRGRSRSIPCCGRSAMSNSVSGVAPVLRKDREPSLARGRTRLHLRRLYRGHDHLATMHPPLDGRRRARETTNRSASGPLDLWLSLLGGLAKQAPDLVEAVSTVPAQGADEGKPPSVGPVGDGLRPDSEHVGHFPRSEQKGFVEVSC